MKFSQIKCLSVNVKNGDTLALVLFEREMISIISPHELDLQEEEELLDCINEYIVENINKYKNFKLFQFGEYKSATIKTKTKEIVAKEDETDQVINIFRNKDKEEKNKNVIQEIHDELDKILNNNLKELPEYKDRKFIFRRELVLNDENVKTSPMNKMMIQNPIFKELDGKEIEVVKEMEFMGKKKILGYISNVPLEIRWCEEIK